MKEQGKEKEREKEETVCEIIIVMGGGCGLRGKDC